MKSGVLTAATRRQVHVLVPALIAVAVRLPRVFHGLPYVAHPDEPVNYSVVHRMVADRSALPRFYDYPSLQYDIQGVAHGLLAGLRHVFGGHALADMGMAPGGGLGTNLALSSGAWILARAISVVIAAVGVALVVWIATRLTGSRRWGCIGGCLAAVSAIGVSTGSAFTPDALAGTTALAVVAMVVVLHAPAPALPTRRWALLTGVCLGLAVGAKYNNALLVGAVALAVLMLPAARRPRWADLGLLVATAAGVFLLTTPGVLLDWSAFMHGVRSVLDHYSAGHPGAEGDSLSANMRFLRTSEPVALVLAAIAVATVRRTTTWLLAAWAAAYFAAISLATVRFDRNLTPILGTVAILAAIGGQQLWRLARHQWQRRDDHPSRTVARRALVAAVVAVLVLPASVVQADLTISDLRLHLTDHLAPAREWVTDQVPAGSTVLFESYTPWIDPGHADLTAVFLVGSLPAGELDEYDIVVLTKSGSGRFLDQPGRYPTQVAAITDLRSRACDVRRHDSAGGEWVELVFLQCSGTEVA